MDQKILVVIATFNLVGPILIWFGYLKSRLDAMKGLEKKLDTGTTEITTVTVLIKEFIASQKVINEVTTKTLEALVDRIEKLEDRILNGRLTRKN